MSRLVVLVAALEPGGLGERGRRLGAGDCVDSSAWADAGGDGCSYYASLRHPSQKCCLGPGIRGLLQNCPVTCNACGYSQPPLSLLSPDPMEEIIQVVVGEPLHPIGKPLASIEDFYEKQLVSAIGSFCVRAL